jgi:hypothetical protein
MATRLSLAAILGVAVIGAAWLAFSIANDDAHDLVFEDGGSSHSLEIDASNHDRKARRRMVEAGAPQGSEDVEAAGILRQILVLGAHDDEPLVGVTVIIAHTPDPRFGEVGTWSSPPRFPTDHIKHRLVTDDQGIVSWRCDVDHMLHVRIDEGPYFIEKQLLRESNRRGESGPMVVRVPRGKEIWARVRDQAGRPARDIEVRLSTSVNLPATSSLIAFTPDIIRRTDERGRVRFVLVEHPYASISAPQYFGIEVPGLWPQELESRKRKMPLNDAAKDDAPVAFLSFASLLGPSDLTLENAPEDDIEITVRNFGFLEVDLRDAKGARLPSHRSAQILLQAMPGGPHWSVALNSWPTRIGPVATGLRIGGTLRRGPMVPDPIQKRFRGPTEAKETTKVKFVVAPTMVAYCAIMVDMMGKPLRRRTFSISDHRDEALEPAATVVATTDNSGQIIFRFSRSDEELRHCRRRELVFQEASTSNPGSAGPFTLNARLDIDAQDQATDRHLGQVRLTQANAAKFEVQILDRKGKPVPGSTLLIQPARTQRFSFMKHPSPDAVHIFRGEDRETIFTATASGFRKQTVTLTPGDHVITLPPLIEVSLQVRDLPSLPDNHSYRLVTAPGASAVGHLPVPLDENGEARFRMPTEGPLRLLLRIEIPEGAPRPAFGEYPDFPLGEITLSARDQQEFFLAFSEKNRRWLEQIRSSMPGRAR